MTDAIGTVAVFGAGTMGAGIAGLCANAGCKVLLADLERSRAAIAKARMLESRPPAITDPAKADLVEPLSLDEALTRLAEVDWICEAVIEDLAAKRALFGRIAGARRPGTVVSSNTSGIPLHAIAETLPDELCRHLCITHFFNPVAAMKLVELVPGLMTAPTTLARIEHFLAGPLGKGVVRAKDTVNFVANRIGCFFLLAGLDGAEAAFRAFLTPEEIDTLMAAPVGLPPTGLFGLIDLIGLDVMDLVARNLDANLPPGDLGRDVVQLPPYAAAMLARGQIGRKAGGGFYRIAKAEDGARRKEVFDHGSGQWRPAREVALDPAHATPAGLLFADDPQGRFAWTLMGTTLAYAADLVPEIADDIWSVDRAMRWGYAWRMGPFELLDALGPSRVTERLAAEGRKPPPMLRLLQEVGRTRFYEGDSALGPDGRMHPIPPA